jgi:N-acetylmuramoyl-L-alanine amidase
MMNNNLTLKQLISIVLINTIMWIPVHCRISELEKNNMKSTTEHVYHEVSVVYETFVEDDTEDVESEPSDTVEPIQEAILEPVEEVSYDITDEEIDLIALLTMGEAEGEPEEGKRLVIDSVLNRVDSKHFPDTVTDVIYQPGQYTAMWNTRVDRCYVREDIRDLVIEELTSRTNTDVVFFRTEYYHPFGTPLFQVGNHYFSKY